MISALVVVDAYVATQQLGCSKSCQPFSIPLLLLISVVLKDVAYDTVH